MKAIILARVSTEEQREAGNSLLRSTSFDCVKTTPDMTTHMRILNGFIRTRFLLPQTFLRECSARVGFQVFFEF